MTKCEIGKPLIVTREIGKIIKSKITVYLKLIYLANSTISFQKQSAPCALHFTRFNPGDENQITQSIFMLRTKKQRQTPICILLFSLIQP